MVRTFYAKRLSRFGGNVTLARGYIGGIQNRTSLVQIPTR